MSNGSILSWLLIGASRGDQHEHSRGRTSDHGTPSPALSSLACVPHAILAAICRMSLDVPRSAELLKISSEKRRSRRTGTRSRALVIET